MTEQFSQKHEAMDVYQEMLRAARKMEDKHLVEMITRRIKGEPDPILSTAGCRVIRFPLSLSPTIPVENTPQFWPAQPVQGILSIVCGYCGIVLAFLFLSGI